MIFKFFLVALLQDVDAVGLHPNKSGEERDGWCEEEIVLVFNWDWNFCKDFHVSVDTMCESNFVNVI